MASAAEMHRQTKTIDPLAASQQQAMLAASATFNALIARENNTVQGHALFRHREMESIPSHARRADDSPARRFTCLGDISGPPAPARVGNDLGPQPIPGTNGSNGNRRIDRRRVQDRRPSDPRPRLKPRQPGAGTIFCMARQTRRSAIACRAHTKGETCLSLDANGLPMIPVAGSFRADLAIMGIVRSANGRPVQGLFAQTRKGGAMARVFSWHALICRALISFSPVWVRSRCCRWYWSPTHCGSSTLSGAFLLPFWTSVVIFCLQQYLCFSRLYGAVWTPLCDLFFGSSGQAARQERHARKGPQLR